MSNHLMAKDGSNSFGLRYDVALLGDQLSRIIIPGSSINLYVNININGNKIDENNSQDQTKLLSELQLDLLWSQLQYDVETLHEKESSLKLSLRCKLFNPLINDMRGIELAKFQAIIINFEYFAAGVNILPSKITESLRYLMACMILNLEYRYPFVFSFHGRKVFARVYPWVSKVILELDHNSGSKVIQQDKNEVLLNKLLSLQKKVLYEYNTLNLMKECDDSSSRKQSCRNFKLKAPKDETSFQVSSMTYDLNVNPHSK